ncbi:hypothetical protein VULLAG_LOCUS18897 [Vulpes lagopus]
MYIQEPAAPDIENESWKTPEQGPPSSQPNPPEFSDVQASSVSQKPPSMRSSVQQYPPQENVKPPVQGESEATSIPQGEGQTSSVP